MDPLPAPSWYGMVRKNDDGASKMIRLPDLGVGNPLSECQTWETMCYRYMLPSESFLRLLVDILLKQAPPVYACCKSAADHTVIPPLDTWNFGRLHATSVWVSLTWI